MFKSWSFSGPRQLTDRDIGQTITVRLNAETATDVTITFTAIGKSSVEDICSFGGKLIDNTGSYNVTGTYHNIQHTGSCQATTAS